MAKFQEEKEYIDPMKIPFNPKLKTILFLLRDTGGCGFYRCLQPALALRRHGMFNTITDVVTTTPEHINQADLVVVQSPGDIKMMKAFNFALKQGKPVIVEIDDYLHGVSPHNPGYEAWRPETLHIHRFVSAAFRANAMTVTAPQLAREYFPLNNNIFVLPNFLDEQKWDHEKVVRKDGVTRIGWAGGNAHVDDLKMIVPVMKRLLQEYKGKLKFETMGLAKQELKDTFPFIEFADRCPSCEFQGEMTVIGGETLENYPLALASHGWDIAIAPVIETGFNNCKSFLKLEEYSAVGYPCVASNITPYREAQESGCTVLLARTFQEWYNHLKKLIDSQQLRDEIVKKNKEWVKNYWLDENIHKYQDVYNRIIESSKTKK